MVWSLALCPDDAKLDPVVNGAEFGVVFLSEDPRTASKDFSETFDPTVLSSCVRLLSAGSREWDLDPCHFDVDQAFVHSDLERNIFSASIPFDTRR